MSLAAALPRAAAFFLYPFKKFTANNPVNLLIFLRQKVTAVLRAAISHMATVNS
jgi:hypothetical protein